MEAHLAPLWRSTIGFDRVFDLLNETQRVDIQDNYPPYNVLRTGEDSYRIALPVSRRRTSPSRRNRTN
jgi:molecular chaperone IbpA